jgi:hypothetical protein
MIVYLNEDWTEADGGALELWDDGGKAAEILPTFNRTLVFETSDRSFHGHPTPLPGPRLDESSSAYDAVLVHMELVELTVAVL